MADAYVSTHAGLVAAVADVDVDTIYFMDDIVLEEGITIPADKAELTFDGKYDDVIHRLTDIDSIFDVDTLGVRSSSSIRITFRNMNITGQNYYGIPYIYETGTSGVQVIYRDITYSGPQLVYNQLGLTHFDNCDITVTTDAHARAQEVGEVCKVEFEGESTIRHAPAEDTRAVFLFTSSNPSFTVQDGAKLTVETANYFMFTAPAVAYEILPGASFSLNANRGISESSTHRASSFLVDKGASFRYIQETDSLLNASLYVNGEFTVNEGASVYMQANYADADELIYFMSSLGYGLNVTNPKSFVLYNNSGVPLTTISVSKDYSIRAEQLNLWTSAGTLPDAGDFHDIPQYKWNNDDWAQFRMYGTFSGISTYRYSEGLINPPTPISNFSFQGARVISAGNLLIEPNPIIDNGRPITGMTEPNAKMEISFDIGSTPYFFLLEAYGDGSFELDPNVSIPAGTPVKIRANTPFLIKEIEELAVPSGEVEIIDAPDKIEFKTPPVSTNPVLLRRLDYEVPVIVDDTRPYQYQTPWNLLVSISGPLKAASGEVLENAVVFKDADGALRDIRETPVTVYTGGPSEEPTEVSWDEDKGILVRVTGSIRSGIEYTTRLIWALEVIDEP